MGCKALDVYLTESNEGYIIGSQVTHSSNKRNSSEISNISKLFQHIAKVCFNFQIKVLCYHINSLMQKFFWGTKENSSKIRRLIWAKIRRSKVMGDLGSIQRARGI